MGGKGARQAGGSGGVRRGGRRKQGLEKVGRVGNGNSQRSLESRSPLECITLRNSTYNEIPF